MGSPWSSGSFVSNISPESQGITYIQRYANGEHLRPEQYEAMRAAMYLLAQYAKPPRSEDGFTWQGPEHFMREIWPQIQKREDVRHGFFGDGAKAP